MKVEIIMNGTMKLVHIPENEFEELALSMLAKNEVEVMYIDRVTQILDKQVDKHLVIKSKTRKDG
jgi:N-dimethylarginine dimethylaminohydrolase